MNSMPVNDQDSPHVSIDELAESDYTPFLSSAAPAVLGNEKITVERLRVLYRELLCRVKTVCDSVRVESFG